MLEQGAAVMSTLKTSTSPSKVNNAGLRSYSAHRLCFCPSPLGRHDIHKPTPSPSSPPLPKPFPSSSPEPPHHAGKGGGDV